VTALVIALAAAIGAPLRYVVDVAVQERTRGVFPWGTAVVNVLGSLLLGFTVALASRHDLPALAQSVLGPGFCGAFTTFSTFTYETVRLAEDGSWLEAVGSVAVNVASGLLAAGAGWAVADWLSALR
jgi:CrcB protein